jgi:hypothetical protein
LVAPWGVAYQCVGNLGIPHKDDPKEEKMRKAIRYGMAGLMAATLLAGASPAMASDEQEVINRGNCSAISDWKLRIRTDGSDRLDLNFEAGQVAGQTWRVQMSYNGGLVFDGFATSFAPKGEFDVDVEVANQAGQDVLRGRARNTVTGETCQGSVTANF